MLTVCGDPDTATTWLAQRIDDLEKMGFDVRRQRAGARFDTMKGLPFATEEDDYDQYQESEQEQEEEEPATAPAQSSSHSHSKHRSRSSRSSHSRLQSGPRTPRSEALCWGKKQTTKAQSDQPFKHPANIFSPDGEDPQDRADVAAKAENLESQLKRSASVESALNAPAGITGPPAFSAGQALQFLTSSKEEERNPAEPLATSMADDVDFDPAAVMPDNARPGTSHGTIMSASKNSVQEDPVFSPKTPVQSAWERFLETAQNALSDCRACSHWKSNPNNLGDTLNSIAERLARMQKEGPPKDESAWTDLGLDEVLFCVTCFKREEQLKKALPLNLVCLAPYRHSVKIVLVTFGPDQALQDWLQNELAWALEEGLLKLGSGGEASDLGTDSPAGSWATRDGHIPRLTSWHASVAKNTSHKAAIYFAAKSLEKTLLVNLDGDNLVGPEYLAAVAKTALASKNSWHGKACTAVTCGVGALTGRMAYWALDFLAICGYDQERGVRPSG